MEKGLQNALTDLGLLQSIVQENKFSGLWKWAKKCGHAKVEEIGLMGIWKMGIWGGFGSGPRQVAMQRWVDGYLENGGRKGGDGYVKV
uniref:Uncharacterized protein n=1 Tax=Vitis vinifera TaxID=29760 RepID=A5BK05_VITVI|nr:hypothetical protein VITISV_006531 [Vitis vinifera]